MSILDIIILLVIAGLLVLAWRASRKKGGGCSGNCAQCRRLCDSRDKEKK